MRATSIRRDMAETDLVVDELADDAHRRGEFLDLDLRVLEEELLQTGQGIFGGSRSSVP